MEITTRDLLTVMHGMGFGALFMLAFSGAIGEFYRLSSPASAANVNDRTTALLKVYLIGMVVLSWLTVFSGAYIVYPWYRAAPPAGFFDITSYPKQLLVSNPKTSGWHDLGMEWKEHVAWIAPISMTMVAYVYGKYGQSLNKYASLRKAALVFTLAAFIATGAAGAFGAFLNKYAPVRGGETIQLIKGE
jgi:hypothetical protein